MEIIEEPEESLQEGSTSDDEEQGEPLELEETPAAKQEPAPQTIAGKLPSIPAPRYPRYSTTAQRGRRPEQFFEWWLSLPEWACIRLTVYIYRYWPVCYNLNPKTNKQTSLQQDKLMGTERIKSVDEMMRRYGSGDYGIWLNDISQGKVKANQRTICTCMISTDHNLDDYPPVIPDIEKLDKDDPKNKMYVTWCGVKGIAIPGVDFKKDKRQGEEEGEDMAMNAQVTEQLMGTVKDLTAKVISQAEKRPEKETPVATVGEQGVSVIMQAAELSNKMLSNAATQAAEIASKSGDPFAQTKEILTFVKELLPKPEPVKEAGPKGEDPGITAMKMGMDFATRMMETMRAAAPPPAVVHEPKSFLEQLREQREISDLMNGKRRKNDDDDEDEDGKKTTIQQILEVAPMAINAVAGIVQLGMQMFNSQRPAGEQVQVPAGVQQAATAAAQGPQLVRSPEEQALEEQQRQTLTFLQQIEQPFISHFFGDGTSGVSFAEFIISGGQGAGATLEGRRVYEIFKQQGMETIRGMLLSYHPIASKVQGTPDRLDKFIQDFLQYDAIMAEEDEEEEDEPLKGA